MTSSTSSKLLDDPLQLENRRISHGVTSGEEGGWLLHGNILLPDPHDTPRSDTERDRDTEREIDRY